MVFSVSNQNVIQLKSQCLLIAVDEQGNLSKSGKLIDKVLNKQLSQQMILTDLQSSSDQTLLIPLPQHSIERILLVRYHSQQNYDSMLKAAAQHLRKHQLQQAHSLLHEASIGGDISQKIQQAIHCFNDTFYYFDQLKSKKNTAIKLQQLCFVYQAGKAAASLKRFEDLSVKHKDATANKIKKAVIEGAATADAVNLAKDLANLPANICTPTFLAKKSQQLATKYRRLKTTVLDGSAIKKSGMKSFLSVSVGSDEPAKIVIIEYKGSANKQKPIALLGKGVTFDSGGINMKSSAGMALMKYDMCGSATVMAMMKFAAELNLPINIIGMIGATENMINGKASRPGDVITSLSGKTVEIINTDAEGRLVLCDLLTYCQQHYQPRLIIDIATLTGASIVALGHQTSCLFSNNQTVANELIKAGNKSNDTTWQLPITEEAQSLVKSQIADLRNVPSYNSMIARTIVGGAFLSQFIESDCHWAHLDVAAVAAAQDNLSATGRPVPLLARYITDQAN